MPWSMAAARIMFTTHRHRRRRGPPAAPPPRPPPRSRRPARRRPPPLSRLACPKAAPPRARASRRTGRPAAAPQEATATTGRSRRAPRRTRSSGRSPSSSRSGRRWGSCRPDEASTNGPAGAGKPPHFLGQFGTGVLRAIAGRPSCCRRCLDCTLGAVCTAPNQALPARLPPQGRRLAAPLPSGRILAAPSAPSPHPPPQLPHVGTHSTA
jgi:hypothetical protein